MIIYTKSLVLEVWKKLLASGNFAEYIARHTSCIKNLKKERSIKSSFLVFLIILDSIKTNTATRKDESISS